MKIFLKQKCQTYAGLNFSNAGVCGLSLTFRKVNGKSAGFKPEEAIGQKKGSGKL